MARIARRSAEVEGADMLFVGERRRSRRAGPPDPRGAELSDTGSERISTSHTECHQPLAV